MNTLGSTSMEIRPPGRELTSFNEVDSNGHGRGGHSVKSSPLFSLISLGRLSIGQDQSSKCLIISRCVKVHQAHCPVHVSPLGQPFARSWAGLCIFLALMMHVVLPPYGTISPVPSRSSRTYLWLGGLAIGY
jgi:hypothetical protein